MINKFRIQMLGIVAGIVISFTSLTGCGSKELVKGDIVNKGTAVGKIPENSSIVESKNVTETEAGSNEKHQSNSDNKTVVSSTVKKQNDSGQTIQKTTKSENGAKVSSEKISFAECIKLLGLTKEELISTLKEKPNSIGEGGLEFKENGIRIWFDEKNNKQVEQVFTMNTNINLNGVKIGDKISRFKEVFGNPVSNKNGDIHFKYNGIFLSVNYDTKTGQTYAIYILRNDF